VTYLLDINILSETRKRQAATAVTNWIAATPPERLRVSVLTLGEIEHGIARIRDRGDNEQAAGLERWLREAELGFADRILPITLLAAAAWGRQQHAQPLPGNGDGQRTNPEHTRLLQGIESDIHRSEGHKHMSTPRYSSCQRDVIRTRTAWLVT
jgi:predicted nucleic acid-binding protein